MDKQIEQMQTTFNQIAVTAASIRQMINLVIGNPAMMTEEESDDVLQGALQLTAQVGWMADQYGGGFVGGPERWMLPRSCHPEVEHDQELAEAEVLNEKGRELARSMDPGERIRFVAIVRRIKEEIAERRPETSESRRTLEAQVLAIRDFFDEEGLAEYDAILQDMANKKKSAEGSPATAEEEDSHHVE